MPEAQTNLIPDEWAEIDKMALEDEYQQMSSLIMRAGKLKSDARKNVSEAKLAKSEAETKLEEIEALLYLKYRNAEDLMTEDSKGKKKLPTESTINASIRGDEDWQSAQQDVHDSELEIIDAQHTYDRCYEAFESLKIKKEMLVSIGADRRAELKSLI